jgi:dienelactone hydrolase
MNRPHMTGRSGPVGLPACRVLLFAIVLLALSACSRLGGGFLSPPTLTPPATSTPRPTFTASPAPTATATATATASPTATATATVTRTSTPTPDPYAGYTIESLRARTYGGGEITIHETLAVTSAFTRTLISYPSDGLTIYGFMNVPAGEDPFPVAIVLHGYIDPSVYDTLAYTTRYADALARAGYLVVHPNLRGYPPSDDGPDAYRVGKAVDVLNLLALIRETAGRPGPLQAANGSAIGLMGHSMGGGITWRVITVDQGVGAAVLYGSMHADELINYRQIRVWTGGSGGYPELSTSAEDLARISPSTYLRDIVTPLSIHHSVDDGTVPVAWSEDLAQRMEDLGKDVELYLYYATPHTFRGEADALFMERMIAFFDRNLK